MVNEHYDIFLSYTHHDSSRAEWFIRLFKDRGYSVFWDKQSIPPGVAFSDFLRQAVARSRCVVCLWSRESVKSKWVEAEAREADERGILIPVLLDDLTDDDLPFGLNLIQAAPLHDWDGASLHDNIGLLLDAVAAKAGERHESESTQPPATKAADRPKSHDISPPDQDSPQGVDQQHPGADRQIRARINARTAALAATALALALAGGYLVSKAFDGGDVTDAQIRNIIERLIDTRDDHADIEDLYANEVEYYGAGIVPRADVMQDKRDFFQRWPEASYTLDGDIQIARNSQNGSVRATYRLIFDVRSDERGQVSRGRTEEAVTLREIDGALKIVAIRSTVLERWSP